MQRIGLKASARQPAHQADVAEWRKLDHDPMETHISAVCVLKVTNALPQAQTMIVTMCDTMIMFA